MSKVKAQYLHATIGQTSDGTDTAIDFAAAGHGTVIDVRAFSRLTVEVRPGGSGADFTVNGYNTADAAGVATAIYAKTTNASNATIVDKYDIMGVGWIQVLEDGTASESQTVIVLCK